MAGFLHPGKKKGDNTWWHSGCFYNGFNKWFIKTIFHLSTNWLIGEISSKYLYVVLCLHNFSWKTIWLLSSHCAEFEGIEEIVRRRRNGRWKDTSQQKTFFCPIYFIWGAKAPLPCHCYPSRHLSLKESKEIKNVFVAIKSEM